MDNIEFLDAKSERECAFYADYLVQNIRSASSRNLRGNSFQERIQKLNEELSSLTKKNRVPKTFATQMKAAFNATQLPTSNFRWIDVKDERLCNWVWCYLKSNASHKNNKQDVISDSLKALMLLSEKAFSMDRGSASERHIDILNAFYNGEADTQQQLSILEFLQAKWNEIHINKVVLNWLEENNPRHWDWAWSYLQNITQRPLEQAWLPKSDDDKRAAIIATIDLSDNVDRKALVIDKMKKAWSQKKFREKSTGKKPYSISMTLNTKQKLNALAEEKGMKINDVIEYLVKNEFSKRD